MYVRRQQIVVCKFPAQKRHGAAERQQRRVSSGQQAAASGIKRQTGSRQTAGSRSRQAAGRQQAADRQCAQAADRSMQVPSPEEARRGWEAAAPCLVSVQQAAAASGIKRQADCKTAGSKQHRQANSVRRQQTGRRQAADSSM